MTTPREIAEKLGRPEMAARLGVGLGMISAAVVAKEFPSSWYMTVLQMGREKGIYVPDSVFKWKAYNGAKG